MLSVLMSVYAAERADFLREALESLHAQTLQPRHVVLVQDGPVSAGLGRVISEYKEKLPIELVPLCENVGLARALNVGLSQIDSPWVVRFDTDDICVPQRLALQSRVARSGWYDIFGGQIEEFNFTPGDLGILRRVPVEPEQIRSFAMRRNPLNHMTVCFRTAVVKELGGYPTSIPLMEDYALWLRALAAGAIIGNSPETLVSARVGAGMYARRGGLRYMASELRLQRLCVDLGMKTLPSAVWDGALRMAGFALPAGGKRLLYQSVLRRDRRM